MERVKTSGMMCLAVLSALTSSYGRADDPAWYIGANVGQSRSEIDKEQISRNLLESGFTSVSISSDERDIGYKLFGGYQFNRNISLEGGYFDLGEFDFTATTLPMGTLDGKINLKGLNLDLVGTLPITETFSAFARVGLNYADIQGTFSGTGNIIADDPKPSSRDTNYKFGVGLQYDLSESLGVRAEAERYRIDDAVGNNGDIDLFSIGMVYRFGGDKQSTATSVEKSEPAAVALLPVTKKTEKYCSLLNIQFEIDNVDIQREDMEKLAVLGTFMNKYPITTAVIEGHTDDVGSYDDNMKLSQRRTESVVGYLEGTHHITASRLTAVGYGEGRPIADNDTVVGRRRNRRIDAIITCAADIPGLTAAPARLTVAMVIEYDQNKTDVKPQYEQELRKLADFMKAHPSVVATVEGHTDNLPASPNLAMQISQQRAQNVVNYLVDNYDVPGSRLSTEAFGQTRRVAYNTSSEGQRENRRVNIILIYPKN
jgi:OOP family OmpA-OmpF porin